MAVLRQILLVFEKELRATVRDPHVLAYLLFPVLLYPALIVGVISLMSYSDSRLEGQRWRVDVRGPSDLVAAVLTDNDRATGGLEALAAGELDLVVVGEETDGRLAVTLDYVSTRPTSAAALRDVESLLDDLHDTRSEAALASVDLPPELAERTVIRRKVRRGSGQVARWFAAVLLCGVVPIGMLVAGIYPAVDLIVSERERSTLETTLVAPVPRHAILGGKVLATMALMLVAALGNAVALALTANQVVTLLTEGKGTLWLPPLATLAVLPCLVATALFFAGANLLAVLPARTFKEGEYLASTLMTVLIGVLMLGIGAIALDWTHWAWRVFPGPNLVIALYLALVDELTLSWVLWPTLANTAAGLGLVALCARFFQHEGALFGGAPPRAAAWIQRFFQE